MDVVPSQVPQIKTAPDAVAAIDPIAPTPAAFGATLFPHPADARVTLRLDLPEPTHCKVTVYDLSMRRVAVVDDQARQAGSHDILIQTDKWLAGTYLMQVSYGGKVEVRKLVIQH